MNRSLSQVASEVGSQCCTATVAEEEQGARLSVSLPNCVHKLVKDVCVDLVDNAAEL
jgi:hypothetical protein